MNNNLIRGAALALAAALAGAPAISQAATTQSIKPVHTSYAASIAPIFGFDAPWTGTLQLTIYPDGIIQGYYRPDDNAAFVPVTGGREGKNVWFDIGRMGRLQVNGTVQNGAIVGAAIDQTTGREYQFNAKLTS